MFYNLFISISPKKSAACQLKRDSIYAHYTAKTTNHITVINITDLMTQLYSLNDNDFSEEIRVIICDADEIRAMPRSNITLAQAKIIVNERFKSKKTIKKGCGACYDYL